MQQDVLETTINGTKLQFQVQKKGEEVGFFHLESQIWSPKPSTIINAVLSHFGKEGVKGYGWNSIKYKRHTLNYYRSRMHRLDIAKFLQAIDTSIHSVGCIALRGENSSPSWGFRVHALPNSKEDLMKKHPELLQDPAVELVFECAEVYKPEHRTIITPGTEIRLRIPDHLGTQASVQDEPCGSIGLICSDETGKHFFITARHVLCESGTSTIYGSPRIFTHPGNVRTVP